MLSEAQRQALAVQFRAQQLSVGNSIGRRFKTLDFILCKFAQHI